MLEFILMLLGLMFSNGNVNNTVIDHSGQNIIDSVQTANNPDGDTGGDNGQTPPPKI